MNVRVGRCRYRSPVICASGTFGYGTELGALADYSAIGAVTTKTVTLDPREGNRPPRIFETAHGVLNSIGLENPGIERFCREIVPALRRMKIPFIVSIGGTTQSEYEELARILDRVAGVKAVELNLSCPNLRLKKMVSQEKVLTKKLVAGVRRRTTKTVIAKLTPEVTDITEIARAAEAGGADALSLVNTYYGMALNVETGVPRLGSVYGGYSGRAIKPLSLYRVWRVYQAVSIPVIGGGGIETADDAIEFFLAGASAVSLGTVNMVYPKCAAGIKKGLQAYLRRRGIPRIARLTGEGHERAKRVG
ncbi:MAG: dihydroorotate dehydrogenase [Candidatus Omnitrophica bacterium]|nr:dihydroorotate dehydrogenase [Candidatus Omnitrophota bacterium]